jgi:hypothetical protein
MGVGAGTVDGAMYKVRRPVLALQKHLTGVRLSQPGFREQGCGSALSNQRGRERRARATLAPGSTIGATALRHLGVVCVVKKQSFEQEERPAPRSGCGGATSARYHGHHHAARTLHGGNVHLEHTILSSHVLLRWIEADNDHAKIASIAIYEHTRLRTVLADSRFTCTSEASTLRSPSPRPVSWHARLGLC